jgi:hypothetical protein
MGTWLPTVYLARMDVEQAALPRFETWYATKHGPDLLDAGFFSAQAYHCRVGGPLVCNVYEIPSSEMFYTESYNSKRTPEHDPDRPWILDQVANRSNTAYEQVVTTGVTAADGPWTPGDGSAGAINSPAISTLRFDVDSVGDDEIITWGELTLPQWGGHEMPARAVRLCRQAGRLHPSNPSSEAHWCLLFEWESVGSALAAPSLEHATTALTGTFGTIQRASYDVSELRISLRRD